MAIQSPEFVIMILSVKIRGFGSMSSRKKKNGEEPLGEGKPASLNSSGGVLLTMRAMGPGVILQF